MKFFLISDNVDTEVGMRLVGIDGIPDRHGTSEIGEAIDRYVSEAIGVKL